MMFSCFAFAASAADAACEHKYNATAVAPTCAEKGYTLYTCSKCGDFYKDNYTNALGHSYGEWQTEKDATCSEEGLAQRKCIRCGGFETKTIPVLEHVDANVDGKCDKCGAPVEVKTVFSPFEWLKAFFKAMIEWFRAIFA